MRRLLQLDDGPNLRLGLSNFSSILYPDERDLVARAHKSDADVRMLLKILRFMVYAWKDEYMPDRMDAYLEKHSEIHTDGAVLQSLR